MEYALLDRGWAPRCRAAAVCQTVAVRSCFKNVASAGRARRTVATKSSGTILNSCRLAPKGRAPRMGRVTTAVYKGVHEDSEPPRNAAMASAAVFKTASQGRLPYALRRWCSRCVPWNSWLAARFEPTAPYVFPKTSCRRGDLPIQGEQIEIG